MPCQSIATVEEVKEVCLEILTATGILIAVMCGLATRNLAVMSRRISDHNKSSMDQFAALVKHLLDIKEKFVK